MRKGTEGADASGRGPNIIRIQCKPAGAMADKARKVGRRGPKARRKTQEFGVYSVGRWELQKASLPGSVESHSSLSFHMHSLPFSWSAQYGRELHFPGCFAPGL